MATVDLEPLIALNPSTGEELARIPVTPPDEVVALVEHARREGAAWGLLHVRDRIAAVSRLWKILARDADALADAVRDEIGKPLPEAQFEVVGMLDALRWTVKNARSVLADERIGPGWQRVAMMAPATVRWKPLGVVGVIGTWNYPLLLDVPALAQALVAGNAVAWKPSEQSSYVATLVRDRVREANLPEGLVASLFGGPEVARALIDSDLLAKGFFTGGAENGRQVATALAAKLTPTVMELSGFDPAIVLPDSPLESTVKALTWAAFVGAGQTCISVKRIYVVGDARPFAEALARHARTLRVGDPAGDVDLGPMISVRARDRFHATIREAIAAGAEPLFGGEIPEGPGSFYPPTVLLNGAGSETILEGVFGPVVLVSGVANADEAVRRCNASAYGLGASVWGRDRRVCRELGDRIEAGMVTINDAVTPSGHAGAPFGGTKRSGFGRTRGVLGLREFVEPQTRFERGAGGTRPQLFPYTRGLGRVLAFYRRLFHS